MRILTGTDITDTDRIKNAIERAGSSFKEKIYTEAERAYCESRGRGKYESYAARFAAKEAVSKALGTGISGGISLSEIEIINNGKGKPCIYMHGNTLKYYNEQIRGISIDISLSHSSSAAVAFVAILAEDQVDSLRSNAAAFA